MDLNFHEVGDRWIGGLHGAIREDRLEATGEMGLPQVVAPGSIDYSVQGPIDRLSDKMKNRKYFVHNPRLTLVRLLPNELSQVGRLVAQKLNKAKGPIKIFIPLKGFSFPDRENLPLWDPDGDRAFIEALKENIRSSIPVIEIKAHINDSEFIDPVVNEFISLIRECT